MPSSLRSTPGSPGSPAEVGPAGAHHAASPVMTTAPNSQTARSRRARRSRVSAPSTPSALTVVTARTASRTSSSSASRFADGNVVDEAGDALAEDSACRASRDAGERVGRRAEDDDHVVAARERSRRCARSRGRRPRTGSGSAMQRTAARPQRRTGAAVLGAQLDVSGPALAAADAGEVGEGVAGDLAEDEDVLGADLGRDRLERQLLVALGDARRARSRRSARRRRAPRAARRRPRGRTGCRRCAQLDDRVGVSSARR